MVGNMHRCGRRFRPDVASPPDRNHPAFFSRGPTIQYHQQQKMKDPILSSFLLPVRGHQLTHHVHIPAHPVQPRDLVPPLMRSHPRIDAFTHEFVRLGWIPLGRRAVERLEGALERLDLLVGWRPIRPSRRRRHRRRRRRRRRGHGGAASVKRRRRRR